MTLPRGVPSVDVGQRRYPPVDVALGESRTTGGRPAEFAPMRFPVESAAAQPHTWKCGSMGNGNITPNSPLRDLMSTPVAMVSLGDPVHHIAEELSANAIGAVLVTTETHCIGIITERDLVEHVADGANLDNLTAEEIVTTELVTAAPDQTVAEGARMMVEAGVRHLPIADEEDVIGLVSARDVIAVLVDSLDT